MSEQPPRGFCCHDQAIGFQCECPGYIQGNENDRASYARAIEDAAKLVENEPGAERSLRTKQLAARIRALSGNTMKEET